MAICLSMLRVILKLVVWKICPGFDHCTIFKGFITGKERQCVSSKALIKFKTKTKVVGGNAYQCTDLARGKILLAQSEKEIDLRFYSTQKARSKSKLCL